MNFKTSLLNYLEKSKNSYIELAKDIWDHPESALKEEYASKLIINKLEEEGFTINRGIADMETAFIGSWGNKKPIIGILGEYDALPGLSQKVSAKKEPVQEGAPGHGCGHNLLGVAGLAAAIAVKKILNEEGIEGTIRYYGCPAEETLIGKVLMAREGVFDNLDAAISWHPKQVNTVRESSSVALNSLKINFYGESSHAGVAPEEGRSALDGVILTDIGVNYLREHIIQDSRIHCIITKGGLVPNVVPDFAQIWYYVRAPKREQVENIYARVLDIAKGASLMTGTEYQIEFIAGCYDYIPNCTLGKVVLEKMKEIGAPTFTSEEKKFAKEIISTLGENVIKDTLKTSRLDLEEIGYPLSEKILTHFGGYDKGDIRSGSTDLADVSHIVPTVQLLSCCLPLGVPPHCWQNTATSGSTIGFKGMMFSAKILALSSLEMILKPKILKRAKEEFAKQIKNEKYISPLQ